MSGIFAQIVHTKVKALSTFTYPHHSQTCMPIIYRPSVILYIRLTNKPNVNHINISIDSIDSTISASGFANMSLRLSVRPHIKFSLVLKSF